MQKKLTSIFSALLLVVMMSCGDDDKKSGNSFTYDGKTYEVTQGHIDFDSDNDGESIKYYHSIVLLSKGFDYIGEDIEGSGNVFVMEVRSAGSTIADGTYEFVDVDPAIGDMTETFIYLNYNTELEEGGPDVKTFEDCSAGTLILDKNEGKFSIDINATVNGKELTGHYTGVLSEWE